MIKSQQTPQPAKPPKTYLDFKCPWCEKDYNSSDRKPLQICSNNHQVFICELCYHSMKDGLLQKLCPQCKLNIQEQKVKHMTNDQLINKIFTLISQAKQNQKEIKKQIEQMVNKLIKQLIETNQKLQKSEVLLKDKQQELNFMKKQNGKLQQQNYQILESLKLLLAQKQNQLKQRQQMLQAQREEQRRINEYHEQLQQSFVWSYQFVNVSIKKGHMMEGTLKGGYKFRLMEVGFTRDLRQKQCWGINFNNFYHENCQLMVGICRKSFMQNNEIDKQDRVVFNRQIDLNRKNLGVYGVNEYGQQFNKKKTDFKFSSIDDVFVEYDPIKEELKFYKNDKKCNQLKIKIIPPPVGYAYHPFFGISNSSLSQKELLKINIQVIYPVKPQSKGWFSQFIKFG